MQAAEKEEEATLLGCIECSDIDRQWWQSKFHQVKSGLIVFCLIAVPTLNHLSDKLMCLTRWAKQVDSAFGNTPCFSTRHRLLSLYTEKFEFKYIITDDFFFLHV